MSGYFDEELGCIRVDVEKYVVELKTLGILLGVNVALDVVGDKEADVVGALFVVDDADNGSLVVGKYLSL
jgi:hypothetical protein